MTLRAMRSGGESSAVRLLLLDTCALSTVLRFLSIMYNNTVVLNTENLLPCLFHINLLQSRIQFRSMIFFPLMRLEISMELPFL